MLLITYIPTKTQIFFIFLNFNDKYFINAKWPESNIYLIHASEITFKLFRVMRKLIALGRVAVMIAYYLKESQFLSLNTIYVAFNYMYYYWHRYDITT